MSPQEIGAQWPDEAGSGGTTFVWLIEAPGPRYLFTRNIGHCPDFAWTEGADKALRFVSKEQADGLMMAVRLLIPALFGFETTLGNAWPRGVETAPSPITDEEIKVAVRTFEERYWPRYLPCVERAMGPTLEEFLRGRAKK